MKQAITASVRGIRCDTPGCGYKKPNVTFKQYPKYLNKPCPQCGANLLTQEDVDFIAFLLGLTLVVNNVIGPVEDTGEPRATLRVHMDGSGVPASMEIIEGD